jgi:hypothetical protein
VIEAQNPIVVPSASSPYTIKSLGFEAFVPFLYLMRLKCTPIAGWYILYREATHLFIPSLSKNLFHSRRQALFKLFYPPSSHLH